MRDIKWFFNRLKAMSPEEIMWRVRDKYIQKQEYNKIYSLKKPVTDIALPSDIIHLHINIDKLSINWDNKKWTEFEGLDLFGVFDYRKYKNKWNAGFQTKGKWPEAPFSPTIDISQRVDIGDIRTNWELNRHFQFAALAKSFYCTKEEKYFSELKELFINWNTHNLFLHGVEWTSVMEIAVRVNSWVYMFSFLKKAGCKDKILDKIEHGIIVMVDYITKHRDRFSSANNHLILEMYAVALVGIITDYVKWRDDSLKVLTEELSRQNYVDGVNKEMSLHYQGFVMEAYALLWLSMMKNHIEIPTIWKCYLTAMSEFLADSIDEFGSVMEFGDSDEGKILDLKGYMENYYQYVLNLMGCVLDSKYTNADWHENLEWIVPENLKIEKKKYIPQLVCHRKEGGYTFLRSKDRRLLIGVDHAALGFGSIAAHGHADALSFQMFLDGHPIFIDPGTYNYHCGLETRNAFRKTINHSTVTVDGKDQSEMLGAFLWGKHAECRIFEFENTPDGTALTAEHDGFKPIRHRRIFAFNGMRTLYITDELSKICNYTVTFMLAPHAVVVLEDNIVHISFENCSGEIELKSNDVIELSLRDTMFSEKYGIQESAQAICIKSHGRRIVTKITVWGDS